MTFDITISNQVLRRQAALALQVDMSAMAANGQWKEVITQIMLTNYCDSGSHIIAIYCLV
jgi:hypothetical protein